MEFVIFNLFALFKIASPDFSRASHNKYWIVLICFHLLQIHEIN